MTFRREYISSPEGILSLLPVVYWKIGYAALTIGLRFVVIHGALPLHQFMEPGKNDPWKRSNKRLPKAPKNLGSMLETRGVYGG